MYGWGNVISFEAQEKIYYALAGNITINNCLNVSARLSAVGLNCSSIEIPEINYLISFLKNHIFLLALLLLLESYHTNH